VELNFFDLTIINFFNQFSKLSTEFDITVKFMSGNHLTKGVFLLILFWWGWFRVNKDQLSVQVHLVSTLFASFFAMILARALALLLPLRLRPLHEENLDFILPRGMSASMLEGWSSFPSDHAVLFYALSTGMFYISKKVGIIAILYTTIFIGLPRVYLGLHYPTDVIAGAFIGIVITLLFNSNSFIEKIARSSINISRIKPEIFYPIFFLITYQIADMFDSSRDFISFSFRLMKRILG